MKTILVVAGNYRQFIDFLRSRNVLPTGRTETERYIYATYETIRGIQPDEILRVGTWEDVDWDLLDYIDVMYMPREKKS